MDLPTNPSDALAAGRALLARTDRDAHVVVYCHFDADGLSAGAFLARALPRLGFTRVTVAPSPRSNEPEGPGAHLAALAPDLLIVADLGVRPDTVVPGVPTLVVDHHQPVGVPDGPGVVVSGYGWTPCPSSSWLAYELLAGVAEVDDLLWVAVVGALSDYGDKAPWPRLAEAKRRHGLAPLRECVSLVNAARRASTFDPGTALGLLTDLADPKEVARGDDPRVATLRGYREEVKRELAIARRAAPLFSQDQPFALLHVHSACQIHPLIAQQWSQRLKKYAAIAANSGFLPGRIAFSVRTQRTDQDLPRILRAIDVGPDRHAYGHGHDQASGGHLPPEGFVRVLASLGFDVERALAKPAPR